VTLRLGITLPADKPPVIVAGGPDTIRVPDTTWTREAAAELRDRWGNIDIQLEGTA
jgi:hypothetical protein